jgi:hypothetical protein
MIETLYTNGCSWTFGAELEQDPTFHQYLAENNLHVEDPDDDYNWNILDSNNQIVSRYNLHYNDFNWGSRLKILTGAKEFINDALGGASNTRILRTTLDYVYKLAPEDYATTLIVIGWTASERDEIYANNTWQRWNLVQPFSTTVDRLEIIDEVYIKHMDQLHEQYNALVYNDYARIKSYFNSVFLLSNTLNNLGIKHYFFNALPAWWEGGEYKTDVNVQEEFSKELEWHENQKNIQNFRDSFMHYVHMNDLPTGKYLHPLHFAHTVWADYIWQDMQARRVL